MPEEEYDYETEGRLKRRMIGAAIGVLFVGGIIAFFAFSEDNPARASVSEPRVIEVFVPPPIPPPPPPPPPTPPEPQNEPAPVEEEMVLQEEVTNDEPPPDDLPPEEPSPALGTGLLGDGPNNFGLTAGGGGGNGTGGRGSIGGGGSKFGWYASKVQNAISAALRSNSTTRTAEFSITVKAWVDRRGRVTRAQLVGSTGNAQMDRVIRDQILPGLQLSDPPPGDMPMPINLRIRARQP